jgi:molybdenum cofactor cytidylyltransferase
MPRPAIVAVVLAAGESRRFEGVLKQLLPFAGEPLVRRACRVADQAGVQGVVVVLGHRAGEVQAAITDLPLLVVHNPDYAEGQSTSVRAGLRTALARFPNAAGVLFIPCDQPLIDGQFLRRLLDRFQEAGGEAILAPAYRGRRGAPVLVPRRFFGEWAAVTGDEGGRQVIRRHPDALVTLELDDGAPLLDVDTPEAYQALLAMRR